MTIAAYAFPETANDQTDFPTRRIIFVIPAPLQDDEEALLTRIAKALHADFVAEVTCLLHEAKSPAELPTRAIHPYTLVISFGILPESLGLWLDQEGPGLCRLEQFDFIQTATPRELIASETAKKSLWAHMLAHLDHRKPV